MVSRKDVAKEAGVSPTSVSYYINKSGYVSKEAGKKIQAAIDKLNYHPNLVARSLKSQCGKQLVFLCNEIRNPFYAQLILSATTEAYKRGYFILFSNIMDDKAFMQEICSYQISGIFFSNARINRNLYETIQQNRVPIVMLEDIPWELNDELLTRVVVQNEEVFSEIVKHLTDQNYKRICYISGCSTGKGKMPDNKTNYFKAASAGLKSAGILYDVLNAQDAYQVIRQTFHQGNCPDAFICSNDAVAIGVLKAVQELELCVPKDVAVVGYDNTYHSVFSNPSLTSVDINTEALGTKIISLLIDKIQGKPVDDYYIKPRLVVRESSIRY